MMRQRNVVASTLGTDSPDQLRDHLATHLSTLEEELEALVRERRLNEWRLERLGVQSPAPDGGEEESSSTEESPDAVQVKVRYADDMEWRLLRSRLGDLKHSLGIYGERYGEQHPRIKQLVADIAYGEEKMLQRAAELDEPGAVPLRVVVTDQGVVPVVPEPVLLSNVIAENLEEEKQLRDTIQRQKEKVNFVSERAVDLLELNEQIAYKRQETAVVRDRLNVLRMESKAAGRVSVAAQAMIPAEPHRDRRLLLTLMALMGACGCGVGAAFVRSFLDPSVRQADDVISVAQVPFLGYLPKVRFESELWGEPSEELQERMRMIRTALLDRLPSKTGGTVLITSSGAQAGKTSVVMLLAKSLSNIGKRVLLVDADFRRPSLTKRLKIDSKVGLPDVLGGTVTQEAAIVHDCLPGIDVMPTVMGDDDRDPELIANGVFGRCLASWKQSYDFVLLDSPPILPVADARILAGQVDGAILTLRSSHCRKVDALDAVSLLASSGCRPLGTILVGVEKNLAYSSGQYSGQYSYSASVVA